MNNLMTQNWPSTRFFDDYITRNMSNWSEWDMGYMCTPQVNIIETKEDFRVEMAAPGYKKDHFKVELDNDMLLIYCELPQHEEKKDVKYIRREHNYKSFRRSFHLPNTVEADKIKANYKDGVLSLLIPKKEEARTKSIKRISII